MLWQFLILIAGFFALIYGADQLVKGASSFAKRFGISNLVIGLTIVAFGSSMPEFFVNVFSALSGSSELAVAAIAGANISDVLLVLGVSAMVRPLVIERLPVWREIPFAILGAGMLMVLAMDSWLGGGPDVLSRGDGIALIGFFAIFLYVIGVSIVRSRAKGDTERVATYGTARSWLMLALGFVGLVVGARLIVSSATTIASAAGISEALIGLTVVALGTTLPELSTSVMAAYRGHTDIAVGNIVGSLIFNSLWILGFSSILAPLSVHVGGGVELFVAFAVAALLFPFMINGKRIGELARWEGALFVLLYVAFIGFAAWRG